MSQLDWGKMRYELVKSGVAPKYVKRTIGELKAHYDDLKNQAIKDGLSEHDANDRARTAIGDEQTILDEVIRKPELKSLTWKFPGAIFLFVPILAAITALALSALILTAWFSSRGMAAEVTLVEKMVVEGLFFLNCYVLTPLLGVGTIMLSKQRMSHPRWPAFGILVLVVIGTGWAYSISWPDQSLDWVIEVNWGYSFMPRIFRGTHDLQNYSKILFTVALALFTWWFYKPYEHGKIED